MELFLIVQNCPPSSFPIPWPRLVTMPFLVVPAFAKSSSAMLYLKTQDFPMAWKSWNRKPLWPSPILPLISIHPFSLFLQHNQHLQTKNSHMDILINDKDNTLASLQEAGFSQEAIEASLEIVKQLYTKHINMIFSEIIKKTCLKLLNYVWLKTNAMANYLCFPLIHLLKATLKNSFFSSIRYSSRSAWSFPTASFQRLWSPTNCYMQPTPPMHDA